MAVGKHDFLQSQDFRTVFCTVPDNTDPFSWFKRFLIPVSPSQIVWAIGFDEPFLDVALVVFYVEINGRMGVDKRKFSYRSLHGNRFRIVVRRRAMVGERRKGKYKNSDSANQKA